MAECNSAVKCFRIIPLCSMLRSAPKNPEERGSAVKGFPDYSTPINPEERGVTNLFSFILFLLSFPQVKEPTEME